MTIQAIERLHSFPRDQLILVPRVFLAPSIRENSLGTRLGPTHQKPWRPCWCSRQKNLIKILLNWNTNMAAVTSCANRSVQDAIQAAIRCNTNNTRCFAIQGARLVTTKNILIKMPCLQNVVQPRRDIMWDNMNAKQGKQTMQYTA